LGQIFTGAHIPVEAHQRTWSCREPEIRPVDKHFSSVVKFSSQSTGMHLWLGSFYFPLCFNVYTQLAFTCSEHKPSV